MRYTQRPYIMREYNRPIDYVVTWAIFGIAAGLLAFYYLAK